MRGRANPCKTALMSDTSTPPVSPDTAQVDPDLLDDMHDAIEERDTRWLARTLARMHPADAADLLEQLPIDDFSDAVELLGGALPPEILIELRDGYREEAVDVLPDKAVATALEDLDSDDATTILEDLEDDRYNQTGYGGDQCHLDTACHDGRIDGVGFSNFVEGRDHTDYRTHEPEHWRECNKERNP